MDLETVVKIEGYSVKQQEENHNGQAQSDEIKRAVSLTPVTLLPEPCGFHQNYDSGSHTAIAIHSETGTASNCNRIVYYAGESPLTLTKDVKEGSSRKEASAGEKCKCSISNCSKSFATQRKLTLHLKFDHREKWFKCHLCKIAFRIKSDLKHHLAKHERQVHQIAHKATPKVSVEAVPSQDTVLDSKSSREKSSGLVNHESDPLKLPEMLNSVNTDRKKEEAPAENKLKCTIPDCPKSFANNSKLHAHLKNKHGQHWLFKCQFCGRLCSNKSELETHLVSHTTGRPHNCNACSKSFKYIKDLRIHERKVHQISLASTKKSELVNHDRHGPDLLLKPQSQISFTTTTLNLLDSTNETLEAEPVDPTAAPQAPLLKVNSTNKCDVCLKAFKSRDALSRHRRNVHTAQNEKRFKCHICPKSFVARPKFKQHLYLVHGEKSENVKIFECEFCGRPFPCVSNLESHVVAKHVVDKEYACSVCSKTFVDQEALTKHKVGFHEQTTVNHFCDVCSAGFTSRINLVGHLNKVHQIYVYCYKCGRSFENKSEFNEHLNSKATNTLKEGLEFKCQVCFVSLSTQCNFSIHTDGHLKEIKSTLVT